MRRSHLFGAALVAASLAVGAAGLALGSEERTPATAPGATTAELSIAEVIDRLTAAGYSDIREVEREHGRYEVKARDAEGRRTELKVDPVTGAVVAREHD